MENELQVNTSSVTDRPLTKRERRQLAKQEKLAGRLKKEKTEKFKKLLIGIVILGVVAFLGYKLWKSIQTPQNETGESNILSVRSDDWVKGSPDAKVTIIEYADFECPACAIYSTEILKKLADEYKDNLRIVYRHFPLPQHKKAVDAAKTAESAGKQGKFWEMHDLLYEKQEGWSTSANLKEIFSEYANNLGLDSAKYKDDLGSDPVSQKIKKDEADGYKLKIDSTPTFYVNGKIVSVNNGYDDLKSAIEEALANQ
jgi:protein-disulfide isomerase